MLMYWVIAIVAVLLIWVISAYNRLVQYRNRVRNGWSQVDIVLKNRFDLIPNLVETVKGYASHERETLTQVMEVRSRYTSATTVQEKAAVSGEMSSMLSRLLAVVESYPDLKANENFMYLKQQLTSIEEKIRFARQFYNDTVERYNTAIMSFPTNLLAGIFRFNEEPFFHIDEGERAAVQVKF